MGVVRLGLAMALLALLVGGAGAMTFLLQIGEGDTAMFPVEVVGPGGQVLIDASVHVENATVLRVLEAAARAANVPLEIDQFPGMGAYVQAIGGHRASGASGWIYEVRHAGEATWTAGDRSAAFYALAEGDAVRWQWTDGA